MLKMFCFLDVLPSEIVSNILNYVPHSDLISFSSASRSAYEFATDITWRDLLLRDQEKEHDLSSKEFEELLDHAASFNSFITHDYRRDLHSNQGMSPFFCLKEANFWTFFL
jgi:hypothetical protein